MTEPTDAERAEFEAWAISEYISVNRSLDGTDGYFEGDSQIAWAAWQAARRTTTQQHTQAASPTPPAEQQAAPKAAPGEPSDVEIDDFLDSPACITWIIASNRDRYRLLVRAVLAKWAAPRQEEQEPTAFIHWPINGPPRLVWYSQKALNDAILKTHEDGYKPDVKLYTAPQPAPAPLSDDAKDAARYRWLKSQASEELLNPRAARSEICPDMRTHWKLPTLICSGPVGGYLDFDSATDATRSQAKEVGDA